LVLVLDEKLVSELANLDSIISDVERALKEYSERKSIMPPRYQLDRPGTPGTLRVMLASIHESKTAGLKILTGTAGKRRSDRNYFVVMLFDLDGALTCIMSANRLTQLRTGAASAVATKYLSRTNSQKLGLIGAGVQGVGQLEAITRVSNVRRGFIYDVSFDQANKAREMARSKLNLELELAKSPSEVASNVDILVTATTSTQPILDASVIKPGTHINAVGSNMANRREIATDIFKKGKIFVDSMEQASRESGDIISAISEGYALNQICGEIGEVISGKKNGRESNEEITVFKSVGIAVEDIAAAQTIYNTAQSRKLGVEIDL